MNPPTPLVRGVFSTTPLLSGMTPYRTLRIIFPRTCPVLLISCAAAASASGISFISGGRTAPDAASSMILPKCARSRRTSGRMTRTSSLGGSKPGGLAAM